METVSNPTSASLACKLVILAVTLNCVEKPASTGYQNRLDMHQQSKALSITKTCISCGAFDARSISISMAGASASEVPRGRLLLGHCSTRLGHSPAGLRPRLRVTLETSQDVACQGRCGLSVTVSVRIMRTSQSGMCNACRPCDAESSEWAHWRLEMPMCIVSGRLQAKSIHPPMLGKHNLASGGLLMPPHSCMAWAL